MGAPAADFYYDLASPYAYLAAHRVDDLLPGPVRWRPILLGAVFKATGRRSWAVSGPDTRRAGMREVERRAALYRQPPVVWPREWPANALSAMRAAIYALQCGREREFAHAAYAAAFQRGADLADVEVLAAAGEAAGLDGDAVRAATQEPRIKDALRTATDDALAVGVFGAPTVVVAGRLFWGDDQLDAAASQEVAQ